MKKKADNDFGFSDLPIEVIRSGRRKTISIRVSHGRVEVRVPHATPDRRIVELLLKKRPWIDEKLLQQSGQVAPVRGYQTGDSFEVLGRQVTLQWVSDHVKRVYLQGDDLVVQVPARVVQRQRYVKRAIEGWFRDQTLANVGAVIDHYGPLAGVAPTAIKARRYKARWGSCNHRGELSFNWLIPVAPQTIVDYVVVHELCHLRHMNHSQAFWACVEALLPDYRQRRQWLRCNGWRLVV